MNQRSRRRQCTLQAISSWENLFEAARLAQRGKRHRPDVAEFEAVRETNVRTIRDALLAGDWIPKPYRYFTIHHPKRRIIAAAPFEDRVVHHALCLQLGPLLQRRFIARSFSCQVGKGTVAARECCRRLVNGHRHVLKCDVAKFFPSIDHRILSAMLERHIECPGARRLISQIIRSYHTPETLPRVFLPGDDWTDVLERPRGLPIGNLTSQLWGNFYLDPMDHWITEVEAHGEYLRYTDDFLLFSNDRDRLWELHAGIRHPLAAVRLKLSEPKSRMLSTGEGVPFCGFRFFPSLRPRILGATKRRFETRLRRLFRDRDFKAAGVSVFAWHQFSREGNSEGLRRAYARRSRGKPGTG